MKSTVTVPFSGVPDGAIHPKQFKIGDVIDGNLAVAMTPSHAKMIGGAPENKMREDARGNDFGPTGEAQQSSSRRPGRPKNKRI
jgi:hypothetical protein